MMTFAVIGIARPMRSSTLMRVDRRGRFRVPPSVLTNAGIWNGSSVSFHVESGCWRLKRIPKGKTTNWTQLKIEPDNGIRIAGARFGVGDEFRKEDFGYSLVNARRAKLLECWVEKGDVVISPVI